MKALSRSVVAIVVAGIWVNASEFFRNQVLLRTHWNDHYQSLRLTFPSEPLNALLWVAWGFLFATMIFVVSRKFTLMQTTLITWLMAFVMMWLVAWNLNVLPITILVAAVPLSLLEAFIGSVICMKLGP